MQLKKIISFSGGKDSTALILWAKENLKEFITVFCDTYWEHPITYAYIKYINETLLENKLIVIGSDKYGSFEELCFKKKRVPSSMARFCTEELKLKVMKKYIQGFLPNVEIYVGVRADESFSRRNLPERAYADFYDCDMVRPLIKWSAEDCFAIIKKYDIEPNPLYKMGMKRVGCMPCIMTGLPEMRQIIKQFPEVIDKIKFIENKIGRSFFPPNYIPHRFTTGRDTKSGKSFPWVSDVVKYLSGNPNQEEIFEGGGESCMSYYSICE